MKVSVCIPTHERHALLARCLTSLLQQARLPDEVVVADSSTTETASEVALQWAQRFQHIKFTYVRTQGRSVMRNRWEAFFRSSGDLILFADDDIRFTEDAMAQLYTTFEVHPEIAGAGFKIYYEASPRGRPIRRHFRDWWLGNTSNPANSLSTGGLSTFGKNCVEAGAIPVQWLSGGAMCFRREALTSVGQMTGIDDLFNLRIGVSEDIVLSRQVGLTGPLMLLTQPLAWHPDRLTATSTALSTDGWRRGLRDTVGQAHALRWLACDRSAVLHDWLLLVTLNAARAAKQLLAKPFAAASWLRLLGFFYGCVVTLVVWRRIPDTPNQALEVNRKWLLL